MPPKPHSGTNRRARPRSVFNVKLFNGNLESFVKVLVKSGLGLLPTVSPTVSIIMTVTQPLTLSFSWGLIIRLTTPVRDFIFSFLSIVSNVGEAQGRHCY